MRHTRKILLGIGIAFIVIQFVQPTHNNNIQVSDNDILKTVNVPDSIQAILKTTCYDCHSNNTTYPWYSNIQPMGWMMANHIKEGKEELNFSEFGNYSQRKQLSKLNGIANSIRDDIMPLPSYKLMHKQAQLSKNEKLLLINWAQQSKDSLSAKK
jgi:hypothetical protein